MMRDTSDDNVQNGVQYMVTLKRGAWGPEHVVLSPEVRVWRPDRDDVPVGARARRVSMRTREEGKEGGMDGWREGERGRGRGRRLDSACRDSSRGKGQPEIGGGRRTRARPGVGRSARKVDVWSAYEQDRDMVDVGRWPKPGQLPSLAPAQALTPTRGLTRGWGGQARCQTTSTWRTSTA
eukprot:2649205-Rhodomonas_salina.1